MIKPCNKLRHKLDEIGEAMASADLYEDSNKMKLKSLLSDQMEWKKTLIESEESWLLVQESLDEAELALAKIQ